MAYIYLSIAKRKRLGVRKDGFCYYITAWPESLFFVVQSAKIQECLKTRLLRQLEIKISLLRALPVFLNLVGIIAEVLARCILMACLMSIWPASHKSGARSCVSIVNFFPLC